MRRPYLASAAGDLEALCATLAPDVRWTEMVGFPLAGTYRRIAHHFVVRGGLIVSVEQPVDTAKIRDTMTD